MIAYILYLILLLSLIYFNGFFNLFKDERISRKQFTFLFFLKTLAIPVFYFVYQTIYGGIEKFDSGKFYNDASVISDIAKTDLPSYLKLLFGFQNDQPGTYDFLIVHNTLNWDNGEVKDFLYNDNRVLIRIHSIVHFFSFHSVFVHALFSCFISFIGIFFLYKTFAEYFSGKELWLLLIPCLYPALWFYTGALLKEGLSLFVLGCLLFQLKNSVLHTLQFKNSLLLCLLLFLSLVLKPYLLFLAAVCFGLFFYLKHKTAIRNKVLIFILLIAAFVFLLNSLSLQFKNRSLTEAALNHQRIFAGVAKGGIFLYNADTFIRLAHDTALVAKVDPHHDIYSIRKHASYMYWRKSVSQDTLYCTSNEDTLSRYRLAYKLPLNNSNLEPLLYSKGLTDMFLNCYYYSLFYPLFYNATSLLQYLASAENVVVCTSILLICFGFFKRKKDLFLPFVFLFFALSICLLIGIATPNSGAIFRYRSPAMIFVLLAALYFIDSEKLKIFKRLH